MGNREALLEAAIGCLREKGYGATRARDLAQSAGVSLGAIRYHFGSTETLLNEAVAESIRRWIHGFQASMAAFEPDAGAGLVAAAGSLYDDFDAHRALVVGFVEAFAHAQRSPAARVQMADYYDEFRREITLILPDGGHDESTASIILALVDGLMIQWLLAPDRCPDPVVLQHVVAALVKSPSGIN